jgi:hypothetical protein
MRLIRELDGQGFGISWRNNKEFPWKIISMLFINGQFKFSAMNTKHKIPKS